MVFAVLNVLLALVVFYFVLVRPARQRARLNEQAPARRRWALALCDIQLRRNGLPYQTDALRIALPPDRLLSLRRSVLAELEIDPDAGEADLRTQAQRALSHWAQGMGRDRSHFFAHMAQQGRVRQALAFDCARTAFLVRCLALLELCSEEAAWLVLLLNAQRAQDSFRDWTDFGRAYANGRQVWLSFDNQATATQRAEQEVEEYLNERDGNWSLLPWSAYKLFDPQPLPSPLPSAPTPSA